MDPERRASHTALISAGLLEHGWDVEEGGTLFKPGHDIGYRFETGNANYMRSVAAMPHVYAPTYMLIANIAFGCASLPYENQDECIPEWLSEYWRLVANFNTANLLVQGSEKWRDAAKSAGQQAVDDVKEHIKAPVVHAAQDGEEGAKDP